MESHRSLTTTAALIHGAGEVELLLLLLFDIVCGATEVDYYSYSYLTLKVERLVRFGTFVAD